MNLKNMWKNFVLDFKIMFAKKELDGLQKESKLRRDEIENKYEELEEMKKQNVLDKEELERHRKNIALIDQENEALDEIIQAIGDKKISDEIYQQIKQAADQQKVAKEKDKLLKLIRKEDHKKSE